MSHIVSIKTSYLTKKILYLLCLLGFGSLVVMSVFYKPDAIRYEEEAIVRNNVDLIEQHGLSAKFLVKIRDQAPGPVNNILFYALRPLIGSSLVGARLVMVFLFAVSIFLSHKTIGLYYPDLKSWWIYALAITFVPSHWQSAGVAMSNIPALVLLSLFLYWLSVAVVKHRGGAYRKSIIYAILAGLVLGLATLTRSTSIVLLGALPVLLFGRWTNQRPYAMVAVVGVLALLIAMPVFVVWGGFSPPHQQIGISDTGINPTHGFLACGYMGLFVFLMSEKWLVYDPKIFKVLGVVFLVVFGVSFWFTPIDFVPFQSILKHFPTFVFPFYSRLMGSFLIVFAFYFVYHLVLNLSTIDALDSNRPLLWFCGAAVLMVVGACAKVTHQFSQVYAAQATPFLVILLVRSHRFGAVKVFKYAFVIGSGLYALAQLRSHYV